MTNPIPDDYPKLTPALCVDGANDAIAFYTKVLGATERMRISDGGKVGHAELEFDDSLVMISDEYAEIGVVGPKTLGGTAVSLNVYVEDVDATFAAALAAGATELRPVSEQFYGDRAGQFLDPWGHRWGVASRVEELDHDELARRAAEAMGD
ncbi:MAG: VOC family protein [Acidimicrobiaceae bacterium]|nr:VOC family protein [Acidimicrobiaceae bacterium]MXW75415.1 VOC family protein [Acidimicrobiaceae bacterium]MYA73846.1 VOC family protein [Acidimicrobiaceae bacterium]MYD06003.1 VOC family protein [Acidimicrobiaceae bacterium]MYG54871.1 VOC family protein [Acidimicrobiaceae bacterium]